jgi:hypothetical protein
MFVSIVLLLEYFPSSCPPNAEIAPQIQLGHPLRKEEPQPLVSSLYVLILTRSINLEFWA